MSDKIEAKVGGKVLITASNKQLRAVGYGGKARKGGIYTISFIDGDEDICVNDEELQSVGPYIGRYLYKVIE